MASGLPTPNACCSSCPDSESSSSSIPGPQGPAGADGTNGTNGVNAYTTLTAGFTQPASGSNVAITVANTSWMAAGQIIFIVSGGDYQVVSVGSSTVATIKNLGYPNNAAASTSIANSSQVVPSGQRGAAGADGSSSANPTTTKGDISTHDSTAAARLPVGSDYKFLMADSSQGTGLNWVTVWPTSAVDNALVRYDGTSGRLAQNSAIIATDSGDLQTTGGNARGTNAVDLQTQRGASDQVASGQYSFLGGGQSNKASGDTSVVTGGVGGIASGSFSFVGGGETNQATGEGASIVAGELNVASNDFAFVGGGSQNTASGFGSSIVSGDNNTASADYGFVGGGQSNTVSGQFASVVAGSTNTASATNSSVVGGSNGKADKYGQIAHSSGKFSAQGDAQTSELVWRNSTTDGTTTELFLDGSASRATITQSFSWIFHIHVVGRDDAGNSAVWELKGGIKNNAGSTSLIGSVTTTLVGTDAGISATWGVVGSVAATADDTNDSLKIAVTGAAATNIRWVAHARIVEVKY